MGGFASSFETAASSGANSTVSGVPVGNSVGGDGGGFAPASSFSTRSALPDIGTGGGTDWTGQAFAPSAMTQPLPEPGLPETSDWKPQPISETPSSNLLEKFAPKPAAGSGLLAETPLQPKRGESEGLRNVNPILSKLAAEHPENPVHLKGGLLGALPTQQQPAKPPNPFAQRKDELPKLPKIDWGAYDKHRIDGQTRLSHDDWARIITSTKDFGGIIPTLVRTVNDGGDGGKANVADVLWRVAQKNSDHARFFHRELTSALGGETIPIRQALMQGEVSPAQLVDPAKSPGLLGTAKPNRFADPDFEKSYWQNAEAYKAEVEKRRQEANKETSPDMRAYPQQQDPYPDATPHKPDGETQVAAGPAAVLAAPYIVEGAAAASAAAGAYWAAHPELHPEAPDWLRKMMGKNETSIADPEAAKPKIETFPADPGKPAPLEGYPGEPQRLSGKEAFPAQESKKGDNIIHEQRPSKVDVPDILDMNKLPKPMEISKDGVHPETKAAVEGIADGKTRDAVYETMIKNGTITHAGKGQGTNIIAPPVPKGQEDRAAKAAWVEGVRRAGGEMTEVKESNRDGITTLEWKAPDGTKLKYRDGSSQGQPTYELERENPGTKMKDRIKVRFIPR